MACRKLTADIDQYDVTAASMLKDDVPWLPEVGEELDELDAARDDLVEEQRRLHESGECPGTAA
jgi:hypothetical protein